MKTLLKKTYLLPVAALALTLGSCMDDLEPQSSIASTSQISQDSEAFSKLITGLKTKMTQTDTYGGTGSDYVGSWTEAVADWGYPNYMFMRDVCLDGMPTTGTDFNYQYTIEACTNLATYGGYPYYYYYSFINNCNRILAARQEATSPTSICQQLAIDRTYRALSYLHLCMMYEFYKTGIDELDQKAKTNGVMGLTVPLVTEKTTNDEAKNNPRAPFYTMYRFIYNDLATAETNISDYDRSDKNDINIDVVNVLMARFWMILGSRFSLHADDLATQLSHESDADGYKALGITSADDCFRKASAYADKVMAAGYSPTTQSQWQDVKTGFNTANQAWIWDIKYSSTENTPRYWMTLTGNYAVEPAWAFPAYTKEYRCISSALFDKIGDDDFRKTSWVAPEDAGAHTVPAKYNTQLKDSTATTAANNTSWHRLPAYASLKFRAAGGNMDAEEEGLLVQFPLMRVEEMYFIKAEAALHTQGLAAAKQMLEDFINSYRYTKSTYKCKAASADEFIAELIAQKYIEFWGEDIMFNDYKRLGLKIDRTYEGSNYLSSYKYSSTGGGYVAPWLNFYIPEAERSFNQGIAMNPDATSYAKQYCK